MFSPMEKMITVHIADDHQILIDGVKAVLNLEPNIEVTGFSLNGNEVIAWYEENNSDVLVLDINMPELDGIEVLKKLKDINELEGKEVKVEWCYDKEDEEMQNMSEEERAVFMQKYGNGCCGWNSKCEPTEFESTDCNTRSAHAYFLLRR